MSLSFILRRNAPYASHLLCKNNVTWHSTTLTGLFLAKTFGNQFASPIIFQIPRQSNACVWHIMKSPPFRGCLFWDTLMCNAWWKWGLSERYFLSLPWGRSNRDLHCLSLAISWGSLCWTGLTWQAYCAAYWFINVLPMTGGLFCAVINLLYWTVIWWNSSVPVCSQLCATRDRLWVTVHSSGKSHGFINIDFNSVS